MTVLRQLYVLELRSVSQRQYCCQQYFLVNSTRSTWFLVTRACSVVSLTDRPSILIKRSKRGPTGYSPSMTQWSSHISVADARVYVDRSGRRKKHFVNKGIVRKLKISRYRRTNCWDCLSSLHTWIVWSFRYVLRARAVVVFSFNFLSNTIHDSDRMKTWNGSSNKLCSSRIQFCFCSTGSCASFLVIWALVELSK